MNKPKVLFDITMLENSLYRKTARTGTYFVAYNVLREFLERGDMEVSAYSNNKKIGLKYLRQYFPGHSGMRIVSRSGKDAIAEHDAFFATGNPIDEMLRRYNPGMSFYQILYDIIPIIHPEYFPHSQSPAMVHMVNNFENDYFYFSISQCTRNDVVRMGNGINPDRIKVVPLAANDTFYQCDDAAKLANVRKKYRIPSGRPYILSLCTREPRKNLIAAITAFVEFIHKNRIDDLVFVLAGSQWKMFREELRRCASRFDAYADRIIETGYVDDEDLAPLYSGALWFVYTSKYEGFGLPPLEAMQCGCPVVASTSSSLPEVVGQAGLTVDSESIPEHVQAFEQYYFSEETRHRYAALGLERAAMFTWRKCADTMAGQIVADHNKKAETSPITVLCIANCAEQVSMAALESTVDSITRQNCPHMTVQLCDKGLDADKSRYLEKIAASNDWKIIRAPCDVTGDAASGFVCVIHEGSRFLRNDYLAFSLAKSNELGVGFSIADREDAGAGRHTDQDGLVGLIFGKQCAHDGFLIRADLFEQYLRETDTPHPDMMQSLALRLICNHIPFVHHPAAALSSAPFPGEYAAGSLPQCDGLADGEVKALASGDIFRNQPLDIALNLIGKIPDQGMRKIFYERLFRRKFFPQASFDELNDSVRASKHLLFGFIPIDVRTDGGAISHSIAFSILNIPLLTVKTRYGARTSAYMFGLVPIYRSKRRT